MAIVLAALIVVGYREFDRHRNAEEFNAYVEADRVARENAARMAQAAQRQASQAAEEKRRAEVDSRRLYDGELCTSGTVVLRQETTTEVRYTQRLENGRPVPCSGRFRLTPRPL